MEQESVVNAREYLLISDFDQTLSFNDSGYVLSELVGISGFADREVIESALEGIVPADHIYGGLLEYDGSTGEVKSVLELRAGYGKVVIVDELRSKTPVSHDHVIYVGDGSSDIHVMLHVINGGAIMDHEAPRKW